MWSTAKQAVKNLLDVAYLKGVRDIVISPGSRNAPIVIAANKSKLFRLHCVVDERCAAFFALGIAQQTQQIVAITCTSGTAVLNYAPALAEAYYQKIPLLVLSADRPKEWIDQMDGQTIRQFEIFQNYIKKSFEFPTEPSVPEELWHCNRIASEAMEACVYPEFGPVHINLPFREPLYTLVEYPDTIEARVFSTIKTQLELSLDEVSALQSQWKQANKILIVSGLLHYDEALNHILETLALNPKVAVLTETTSNLFGKNFNRSIDRLISTIEDRVCLADFQPDLLITLGGPVVSKKIKSFLRKNPPHLHWHINASNDFVDTYQHLSQIIPVKAAKALKIFTNLKPQTASNYGALWLNLDVKLSDLFKQYMQDAPFSDLWVMQAVLNKVPQQSYLQLANSTAVRYSNLFNTCADKQVYCYSNRGTSGIDGTISTAVGAALAVPNVIHTVISGDLSFLYDSNALWIKPFPANLKIIVINNGGGNIFRIIDGPSQSEELENYFEAQHNISLEFLCKNFQLSYHHATDKTELLVALEQMYATHQPEILEVSTTNTLNPIVLKNYFNYLKANV